MAGDQGRENTRCHSYCLKRQEEICMVQFCTYKKVVRTYNCLNYSTYVRTCTENCITIPDRQQVLAQHQLSGEGFSTECPISP